ncbi:MAG TPA: acetylornithine/succinylornithine family transaminase [Tepidisphaeraceae bacterium]|jgi:predicted acetylornithine/succinylornithine family transaminase|nr:acetylornithine/succinylornithine family transaminase [Tepidisphaeraceae bacterium]
MSDTATILKQGTDVLIGNYARMPVVMARGEGSYVWDTDGKKYIDLFAGFGAGIIGHSHPALIAAATEQAKQLWHVGNTFYTEPQIAFAQRLNATAFTGKAFFCHSGLEANEAAVKLARLAGRAQSPHRWKTVSMHKSFHGRSMAMIAATGNPAVKQGFEPAVPGFSHVDFGDLEGLAAAIDSETAAVMMEPIQGEGGVHMVPNEYAVEVRRLCTARNVTLIFDEVWTGCGRTGRWFGYQHFRDASGVVVEPDIMTLGKAVGGGLPVGVMFAKPEIAAHLVPGKHGSTLGGNPICMAVSKTIFDVIEREKLVDNAATLGEHAIARLKSDKRIAGKVAGVRGRGLFIGIELKAPPEKLNERALENGVNLNLTSKNVIRLAPPINIDRATLDEGLDRTIATIAAL